MRKTKPIVAIWSLLAILVVGGDLQAATITSAEYFIDVDPGKGNGIPLQATDGAFDEPTEEVEAVLNTAGLSIGTHVVYVRMKDSDGNWGPERGVTFTVRAVGEPAGKYVAAAEYFIDTDPGEGNGTPLGAKDGKFDEATEEVGAAFNTSGLSPGEHTLYVRMRDSDGKWGKARGQIFTVVEAVAAFPDIAVSDTTHTFGEVGVDSSATWVLVVSNLGDLPLVVESLKSSDPSFIASPQSFTVPPKGSQNVTIIFQPSSAGPQTATFTIISNDPDEPTVSVVLTGTGIPVSECNIKLSATSHNFGTVLVGTYADWNLAISNVGNVALTISSITSDHTAFTILSPDFPQHISPGDSLDVTVRFSPTAEKQYTAILTIASSDPDEPEVYVSVEGEGRVEKPPVADPGTDQSVSSGYLVRLDGSNSHDLDGTIVRYQWNFGDGETATGPVVDHRFRGAIDGPKTYAVTLTVEDNEGLTDTDTVYVAVTPLEKTVEITHQPLVPIPGQSVFARMTVSYNWIAVAQNGEDAYIISKIWRQNGGFDGYYDLTIWDCSTVIPGHLWSDWMLTWPAEKTYLPPFKPTPVLGTPCSISEYTFDDGTFRGILVRASDAMSIVAVGWAGIHISVGPSFPPPFIKWSKATFMPESTEIPDLPIEIPDGNLAHLCSPGELRVHDSQERVTGLVNGEVKEEIPFSGYQNGTVIVLSPSDSYRYEVVGTGEGTYALAVSSVTEEKTEIFGATDIPTSPNAVHQYTIDWDALSKGEKGVTLQMDSDGDGTFEHTVTAGDTLTPVGTTPPTGGVLKSENIYTYPNPFNPGKESATLRFSLSKSAKVTVKFYDVAGQWVATLAEDQVMEAKVEQSLPWDGKNDKGDLVASGIYFCVITTDQDERAVCKGMVLR